MDNAPPLRGVTATPLFPGWIISPNSPERKFLQAARLHPRPLRLSFKGNCQGGVYHSSLARPMLRELFRTRTPPGVEFTCIGRLSPLHQGDGIWQYLGSLANSTCVIVPHGDARWNIRFTEVLAAGAIPVIIADGTTLPYSQLIDWSKALIRITEEEVRRMSSPEELLGHLPNPEAASEMQEEVRRVFKKYFSTPEKQRNALFKAARVASSWPDGR